MANTLSKPGDTGFKRLTIGALLLFFLLAYLLPLGLRPMVRPDEYRYAEIPREMIQSGNWNSPTLIGIRYFEKPALGYQLTAWSFRVFGENAFALRLPSALGAGLAALFLYLLLVKYGRDPWLAPLGTLMFLSMGLVYGVGTFAVIDSQLNGALTVALAAFFFASQTAGRWRQALWLVVAGAGAGVAFLLKGAPGLAVPAIVAGGFLLWRGEWKRLFTLVWLPLIAAALVVLPAALAAHRAEPDFWPYFIVVEHLQRFTGSTFDRDPQPPYYFIPVLLGGIMPAGLLAAAAWCGWRKLFAPAVERSKPWLRRWAGAVGGMPMFTEALGVYLFLWAVLPFLLFSASSCKLGTYILPCFPALAALLAWGVLSGIRECPSGVKRMLDFTLPPFGILLIVAGLLLVAYQLSTAVFARLPMLYLPGDFSYFAPAAVLVLWGGLLVFGRNGTSSRRIGVFLFGIAPAVIAGMAATPLLGDKTPSFGIAACLAEVPIGPEDRIYVHNGMMHALAWELNRTDFTIVGKPGELAYPLEQYPEYAARQCPDEQLDQRPDSGAPGRRVLVTARSISRYRYLAASPHYRIVTRHGVTFIRF
jgi:4-amino-4-deoxy-L-arabinose transferase